jgi:chromosome segregation ATPase
LASLDGQADQITATYATQIDLVSAAMDQASGSAGDLADKIQMIEAALASRQLNGSASELMRYRDSQASLRGFANGGSFDTKELERVLGGLSTDTEKFFSSRFDYELDFAKTTADLRKLQDGMGSVVPVDEQQLAALNAQIAILEEQRDAELAAIQDQRDQAQAIYDATITGQQSFDASLAGLQAAANEYIAAANASTTVQEETSAQIAALQETASAQITTLEALLANGQAQYDAAIGASGTLGSVDAYLSQLNDQVAVYNDAQAALDARQSDILAEIAAIEAGRDAEIEIYQAQLETAQASYDLATGQAASLTSVDEGVTQLNAALATYTEAQDALMSGQLEITARIAEIEAMRDEEIATLQAQLDTAQALYDTATGQAATLTSIDAHMGAFNATLAEYTAAQVTLADVMAINQPLIDSINATLAEQTGILEAQLASFQDQFAPLTDLPTALATLQAAIQALADAQAVVPEIPEAPQSLLAQQLDTIYNRTLGRDADASGEAYYTGRVMSGTHSLADIEAEILASPEYRSNVFLPQLEAIYQAELGRAVGQFGADLHYQHFLNGLSMDAIQSAISESPEAMGIPSYATGTSNHPGGLAMVGENGPELVSMPSGSSVSTASQTRSMFDNSELVAEVRLLKEMLRVLHTEAQVQRTQVAKNTKNIADDVDEALTTGMPVAPVSTETVFKVDQVA